nr:unnamed protein product [Digitaria exilis]
MASDEFISLETPCEADVKGEEGGELQAEAPDVNGAEPLASELQPEGEACAVGSNPKPSDGNIDLEEGQVEDLQAEAPDVNGAEPPTSELQPEEEAYTVGSNPKPSDGNIDLEEGQVEDMDLEDDDVVVVKDQLLDASVQPEVSVPAVQTLIGFEVNLDKVDGAENAPIHESNIISVEESRILSNLLFLDMGFLAARGVKRARVESKEPSVRVIYSDLTRESKRKLMELMQQWSQWQARRQPNVKEAVEEILESGEETYYPALHVGSENSCAVVCMPFIEIELHNFEKQ